MGVLSSWEMLATNSLLRASDWAMLSAMALNASASSPTSSQRPPQLTRVSYSPCPNFRTASAISLRGRVIRREVTELVIKATSMTTTAVKRKMLAKARHISVMLPASAETKTRATTCWPPWMGSSTGAPATYRFSGKIPSRSLMAPKGAGGVDGLHHAARDVLSHHAALLPGAVPGIDDLPVLHGEENGGVRHLRHGLYRGPEEGGLHGKAAQLLAAGDGLSGHPGDVVGVVPPGNSGVR